MGWRCERKTMNDFKRRREAFDRDFERTERKMHLIQMIAMPLALLFVLLILGLLGVALYTLMQIAGLV
jgi:hypothetical protein